MTPKRILLLSAYDAKSHQYWHQQLVDMFPQHTWKILTLKDRYFSWRMGGNALSFKAQYHESLEQEYDLVMATSMTDLSTLRSLYPNLCQIPNLLYFHENQFAYPENKQQQGLLEIQLKSLLSATSADKIAFNSNYNRNTFFAGVESFIKHMPDGVPTNLLSSLQNKTSVIPVPIKPDCKPNHTKKHLENNNIEVIWNHRWEHDKGPETLLEVMKLCQNNKNIKFHVIGQQFRKTPFSLQQIQEHHQSQCLSLGYIKSRTQYVKTLQSADIALSTAHHDFQGIAMLEAVACGCKPIAPNRLVYPELYPQLNLYQNHMKDPQSEALHIKNMITNHLQLSTAPVSAHRDTTKQKYHHWLEH
jgi:glycosyltransferase involved in cell wall biosynthesis